MNKHQIQLAKILTTLGALPFVGAVAAQAMGVDGLHVRYFSLTYGAIIVSFLSGMHWGLFLSQARLTRTNLLVTSNIIALLAWGSLLLFSANLQYVLQMLCFITLLLIDRKLTNEGILERWFYELRNRISLLVVMCLIALVALQ